MIRLWEILILNAAFDDSCIYESGLKLWSWIVEVKILPNIAKVKFDYFMTMKFANRLPITKILR